MTHARPLTGIHRVAGDGDKARLRLIGLEIDSMRHNSIRNHHAVDCLLIKGTTALKLYEKKNMILDSSLI